MAEKYALYVYVELGNKPIIAPLTVAIMIIFPHLYYRPAIIAVFIFALFHHFRKLSDDKYVNELLRFNKFLFYVGGLIALMAYIVLLGGIDDFRQAKMNGIVSYIAVAAPAFLAMTFAHLYLMIKRQFFKKA